MEISEDKKDRIREKVKEILVSRLDIFPTNLTSIRNAPFHEQFLEGFKEELKPLNVPIPYLIALASWMHGLNTSLGSGFESLAHILSGGYKKRFTSVDSLKIKKTQAQVIDRIIRELKAGSRTPNLQGENKLIFEYPENDEDENALGFTADNFIETAKEINMIEIKSVRPNSGEARGEKQKILNGKAALKLANQNKTINFYLGFPFDPTASKPTEADKERFFNYLIEFKKFFAVEEVLLGDELWNYLSGSRNTMPQLLEIIKEVVKKYRPSA